MPFVKRLRGGQREPVQQSRTVQTEMAEIDAKVDAGESVDAEKVDVGEDGPAEDEAQALSGAELAFAWITGRVRTAFAFLKPANVRKSFESEPVR